MTIKQKYMLASSIFCLVIIIGIVLVASRMAYDIKFQESRDKAEMMLFAMKAVRKQVSKEIRPAANELVPEDDFITQLQSTSYTANSVFARINEQYLHGIIFKTASVHARNPNNAATDLEKEIIRRLDDMYQAKVDDLVGGSSAPKDERYAIVVSLEETHEVNGEEHFIMAIGEITKESCMECHDTPDVAPEGLLRHYPSQTAGYGHEMDKVQSAEVAMIPIAFINDDVFNIRLGIIAGGLVILVLSLLAIRWGLSRIFCPINQVVDVAQDIASGDLTKAADSLDQMSKDFKKYKDDETGRLMSSFKGMAENLRSLVGQVQRSGIQVTTSATEIAAQARELESVVAQQAASTNQVTATSKEISATTQELVSTMDEVSTVAVETADLAGEGGKGLAEMETVMNRLLKATNSISSKLSVITEKANNINNVVTTISKVADQTNLLSLNAAIEAEKAGEYGLGFSVVAREIRRLADQTEVSTRDIEQIVKEMHSAVSSGVMEMDKFTDEVRRGASEIKSISDRQERIIEQVQSLGPGVEAVNQGMQAQSIGARQISDAMDQLTLVAGQTSDSLKEFKGVTEQLNDAVRELQSEVTRFKTN
ncbi:MAG: methyl-accepting chemotaxis protein [Desulfovibrio sp.]|nr:MAG: methyl-accepting chemotaxis protein [Desulfovibrio sp.]